MRRRITSGWEVESLQRSIDELLEILAASAQTPETGWSPAIDLIELPDRFVVRVDLPGVSPDDLELVLRGRELHVSGHKRAPASSGERHYHHIERGFGPFTIEVILPAPVRPEECRAHVRSGVLEVALPRREDPRQLVHRISIEREES